jgi:hypothetical protein
MSDEGDSELQMILRATPRMPQCGLAHERARRLREAATAQCERSMRLLADARALLSSPVASRIPEDA